MDNNIFLSICITSYKRVKELRRCLDSIDSKSPEIVEVIVSEDCSPQREQIKAEVEAGIIDFFKSCL